MVYVCEEPVVLLTFAPREKMKQNLYLCLFHINCSLTAMMIDQKKVLLNVVFFFSDQLKKNLLVKQ